MPFSSPQGALGHMKWLCLVAHSKDAVSLWGVWCPLSNRGHFLLSLKVFTVKCCVLSHAFPCSPKGGCSFPPSSLRADLHDVSVRYSNFPRPSTSWLLCSFPCSLRPSWLGPLPLLSSLLTSAAMLSGLGVSHTVSHNTLGCSPLSTWKELCETDGISSFHVYGIQQWSHLCHFSWWNFFSLWHYSEIFLKYKSFLFYYLLSFMLKN